VRKDGKKPEHKHQYASSSRVILISIEGFTVLSSDRLILKCLKRRVRIIPYGRFLVGISKWSVN